MNVIKAIKLDNQVNFIAHDEYTYKKNFVKMLNFF